MKKSKIKSRILGVLTALLLAGCAQYRCYDGTYVEDAYDCWSHGGLSYYSRSLKAPAETVTGNWDITGTVTSKTCPTLKYPIATSAKITQSSNGTITIRSAAGLGAVGGKLQRNRTRLSVRKSYLLYSVQGTIDTLFSSTKNSAQLTGSGKAGFLGGKSCDISLNAKAYKR